MKNYNVITTGRAAVPRSKRLREASGNSSSRSIINGSNASPSASAGENHVHANKVDLDAISIDNDFYLWLKQKAIGAGDSITDKVRAGFADKAQANADGHTLDWFIPVEVDGAMTLKLNPRYAMLWADVDIAAGGEGDDQGAGGSSLDGLVDITSRQTITGVKTFDARSVFAGGATFPAAQDIVFNSNVHIASDAAIEGGGAKLAVFNNSLAPVCITNLANPLAQSDAVNLAYLRSNYTANDTLSTLLAGKQATLESGSSIKTINGNSLLGSGDLVIQGGGSDPEAVKFIAQTLTETQKAQARTNIGAGTYSKPSTGIPETDLTSAVRAKLPFVIDGGAAWHEVEQAIIDHRVVIYREYNSGVTYICQGADMDDNFVFTSIDGTTSTRMLLSIDDSWTTQTFQMYTQSEVNTALGNKQNLLTPGTNITISGNVISAESSIFLCTYGSTAVADIITALSAGKLPVCEHTDGRVYIFAEAGASAITFTAVSDQTIYQLQLTYQGTWSTLTPVTLETTSNKVTSVSSTSTDAQYPTAKCLYDLVGDIESLLLALL